MAVKNCKTKCKYAMHSFADVLKPDDATNGAPLPNRKFSFRENKEFKGRGSKILLVVLVLLLKSDRLVL